MREKVVPGRSESGKREPHHAPSRNGIVMGGFAPKTTIAVIPTCAEPLNSHSPFGA
jgi:hypothetical protein